MKEILDYIEAEAKANAAFHITNADNLTKESNTVLNLLLAGAGGALALLVSAAQKVPMAPDWQLWAVGAASAYLFAVAGLLIWRCLWVQDIWPPANEPDNLPLRGYTVEEVREGDLKSRQRCLDRNRKRTEVVGRWLNRCRALAALTPVVTAVVAYVAHRVA